MAVYRRTDLLWSCRRLRAADQLLLGSAGQQSLSGNRTGRHLRRHQRADPEHVRGHRTRPHHGMAGKRTEFWRGHLAVDRRRPRRIFMALSVCRLHAGHTHRFAGHRRRSGTGNPPAGQSAIQRPHLGFQGFSGQPGSAGHLWADVFRQRPFVFHRHFSAPAAGKLRHNQHISNRPVYYRHDGRSRRDSLHLRKDQIPI